MKQFTLFVLLMVMVAGVAQAADNVSMNGTSFENSTSFTITGKAGDYDRLAFEGRKMREAKLNEAEIKRRHALQLEERKIEVLGRLQQLASSTTEIHVNNASSSSSESTSRVGNVSSSVGDITQRQQ